MRPRMQSYKTIDGLSQERDAVPWYWRLMAITSSFMILGGFLMLPVTFDNDPSLRVDKTILAIFALALLTAGLSFTALLSFAVRNPLFQAEAIYLPALTSCSLGLLTIFYNLTISTRYIFNTPALLLTITASVSTIVYGGLLIFVHRRISAVRARSINMPMINNNYNYSDTRVLTGGGGSSTLDSPYQEPNYYDNYIRNLFPASLHDHSGNPPNYPITEEERMRQQMLMLLLQRDQTPTPAPSQSTFHIDWQEDEAPPPANGYYAPPHHDHHHHQQQQQRSGSLFSPSSTTIATPHSQQPFSAIAQPAGGGGLARSWTGMELRPWDGVWRHPAPAPSPSPVQLPQRGRVSGDEQWQSRAVSRERREERRREIEMGA